MKQLAKNFPWSIFLTGVFLLALSLLFAAYDMAAVGIMGIAGSFILFFYGCYLDRKTEQEIADYEAQRKARFEAEMEELEKEDRERYGGTF